MSLHRRSANFGNRGAVRNTSDAAAIVQQLLYVVDEGVRVNIVDDHIYSVQLCLLFGFHLPLFPKI